MSKKNHSDKKVSPKESVFNEQVSLMQRNYRLGNFFQARKIARKLLSSSESNEQTLIEAREIIKKSGIDPIILLAGLGVLIIAIIVAFLVRY